MTHRRLAVLVAAAFVLRMGFCAMTAGLGFFPREKYGLEYALAGQRLLEQGTLVSPLIIERVVREPSALLPPGYVGLVAAVYGLFGVETFAATLVLQLVNAAATSLVVAWAFVIALRLSGVTAAWVAAVLAVINPLLIGFTTYVWETNLFCLGVTLCVWMSLRLSDKPVGGWAWLGYGLFLGGLALLNPALTVAYPFLVLWPISKSYGWRVRPMVRGVSFAVLGWLIAITPWTVRNYVQFDKLMYIRGGFMLELWLGVCPEADNEGGGVYRKQFPLLNSAVQQRISSIGEEAFIEECGQRARAAIAADPWRMVRLVAVRTVDYYLGAVLSHTSPGKGGWPSTTGRAAVTLFLIGEAVVVFLCLLFRPRISRDLVWLFAIVVSFSVVYCLTHVFVRFRAPTEPILAVIVGSLVSSVWDRLRHRPCPPSMALGRDAPPCCPACARRQETGMVSLDFARNEYGVPRFCVPRFWPRFWILCD